MRRSVLGILAPLAFTPAGTALLLNTLDALPCDIWDNIARWWPALLTLLGQGGTREEPQGLAAPSLPRRRA
jgi:hypothetical protein